jgi:hypothetical protein
MNKNGFILAGSILAILSGRLYVGLGGNLNYSFLGFQLHHFYYGISLLILAGILKIKSKVPESVILFLTGLGLGYISDEFDLLLSIGRPYTLQLYNAPLNLAADTILILVLFRLSRSPDYFHGFLPGTEHAL